MNTNRILSALLAVAVAVSTATAAVSPISLHTRSRLIQMNEGYVRLGIHVEPDERNRRVCLEVDGARYQNSCWNHDGTSALTTWRDIKDMRPGKWIMRATIIRNDESLSLSNTLEVTVYGLGYEPPPEE